jgi:hypothetical protein
MEFERIQTLYNRCNPDEPLSPGDSRSVDIDGHGVRGAKWVDRLARRIELSKTPVYQLFTGLRGSGKSTEIRGLAARLSDPKRKHLLSVLIDADDVLDLTVEIDVSDVLALVLQHAERVVLAAEGSDGRDTLKDGPLRRFWDWLTNTDVELGKLSVQAGAGVKAGVELNFKTNPTGRQLVREIVAKHPKSFHDFMHDEFRELDGRARKCGYTGIVVLFDSLEKLRGTSFTWKAVLESAERIFSSGAPFLQLPVHVLYTVPPALTRRMSDPVSFLPMIKVRDLHGATYREGLTVIRELVAKRLDANGLKELFGADDDERIGAIAKWSGGYPREIVRVLQTLLELDHFPVSAKALEQELQRAGNTYRSIVYDSGAMSWLGRVSRSKKLITANDAEREAADLFLQNNVILRYLNDDEWVDVHPSVAELPELAAPPPESGAPAGAVGGP